METDATPATEADARDVAAVLRGERAAFDRLVERYRQRAVAVAYRFLGNIHDAADAAQDAFLRAYRKLDTLDDAGRFGPWLLRIVTNRALNFRRARGLRMVASTEDVDADHTQNPGAESSGAGPADGVLATRELQEAVAEAIAALPEKQRVALTLFSIEGLPQKDVAEIMGCSIELVKWNVFQARKALREALREHLE